MGTPLAVRRFPIILTAVALLTPATTAGARILSIWPESYTIAKPDDGGTRYPDYVTSTLGAQPTYYYTPLRLPAGSVITRVVYFHQGYAPSSTSVDLWGARMDTGRQNLGGTASWDAGGSILEMELQLLNGGPITVSRGRKYFFTIQTGGPSVNVRGIKVFYQPPAGAP